MSNPSRRQPGIEAFTVFPSTGSQIIFSIVFLFFFLIPYIVTFIGREGEEHPAWIMLFSFFLLGVSYVACTRVANAFIRFGTELYEYSLFRPNLLWPVALRLYAIPLVTILVVIPVAGSLLIGTAKSWTIPQSILLGASSSMLLLFLMVGTVYYAISPESNRVVRTIVSVLFFPMKFMGAVLPGVVILAILMAILQSVFPLLNEVSVRTSSAIAYKLEALSTVPLIGPLLLFYLNPWYLLCLIYTSPDPSMQTGTALFIVLSLATGLMLFRLKLWLEVDLDEHALRVYDEWVEVRSNFASTAEKEYGTSSSDMPDSELPTANGQSQARPGASPTLSKLRGDLGSPKPLKNGEFPSEFISREPLWLDHKVLYITGALVLISIVYAWWVSLFGALVWFLATAASGWKVPRAAQILPVAVWPMIRYEVTQIVTKLLPLDLLASILIVIASGLPVSMALAFAIVLFLLRLAVLCVLIEVSLQSRAGAIFGSFCCLVLIWMGGATNAMIYAYFRHHESMEYFWVLPAITVTCVILPALMLAYRLRFKYGKVLHG